MAKRSDIHAEIRHLDAIIRRCEELRLSVGLFAAKNRKKELLADLEGQAA